MQNMRKVKRGFLAAIGVLAVALVAAACGSSSSGGGSSNSIQYSPTGVPTAGPGLTSQSSPSGTKLKGGTVYFTEGSQAPPNSIFPM
jgi:ABC-type glycerol-3-phosphate transport system substrate-binding protein